MEAPPSPDYIPGPEAPPSPDYIPGPEAPPLPDYIPGPEYPEYLPPADDMLPAEEGGGWRRCEKSEGNSIDYPTSRGDDDADDDGDDFESIHELDMRLQKRTRFTTPIGGYEVGDSSVAAAAARQIRPVLTIDDSRRANDILISRLRRERRYFRTLSTTYAQEVAHSHDYCTQIMDYCQSQEIHTSTLVTQIEALSRDVSTLQGQQIDDKDRLTRHIQHEHAQRDVAPEDGDNRLTRHIQHEHAQRDVAPEDGDRPRTVRLTRECTYKDYLNCGPLKFNGTERVIGLNRWFERTESVSSISNCIAETQAPPSPDYIPGLEYPEYLPPADDMLPAEEQPLPVVVSPIAESPGYITESEPEIEPEENDGDDEKSEGDSIDYPTSEGYNDAYDNGDDFSEDDADNEDEEESSDSEEEEEEHLALTVPTPAQYSSISESHETEPFEEGETIATPPPFG
nr:hypothetical protein [Tanacetum cinerariifolium]